MAVVLLVILIQALIQPIILLLVGQPIINWHYHYRVFGQGQFRIFLQAFGAVWSILIGSYSR
jgi:hypothetical protein